ncbi:polysaccharide deacetylase family protein [Streptomonospora litoralis]|uniref:polysaccharide deacetylase family protein n=1 Tax=Streptomonospora litoralis TaxID=2498135 RepID=UPI001F60BE17|nr:polysaccharide deacetylase family protein [Streptomonospora litoralis]
MKHHPLGLHMTPLCPRPPKAAGFRSADVRAASAAVALALALTACTGGEADPAASGGSASPSPSSTPATGERDELTVVDSKHIPGLEEKTVTEDLAGGVEAELSYPSIPNADPFTDRLAEIIKLEAHDFAGAEPDAKSYSVDWDVSVARGNVMAVRLTQREKDGDGERTRHSTYWYNTESGHTAYSTELLAGQEQLEKLHSLVEDRLLDRDGVRSASLQPIAEVYDSLGFNANGDLVAEFDEGQVAPAGKGRVRAVVPADEVRPLLSSLGERAQQAAVVVTPKFEIEQAASAPKGGKSAGSVPGMHPPAAGEVDCDDPSSKCIALTFDDGPGARTPRLLNALEKHDAKATFFVTGGPVRQHPDTVRRTYAEGHELANHTVHHPDLTSIAKSGVTDELTTVNKLVRRETGYTMDLMRPPYGATDGAVADVAEKMGQAQILWNVDTYDWRDRDAGIVSDRAVQRAQPGSIVLMHDIHSTTVKAVPEILERLDDKGYTMVTVSQLLGETEPGKKYTEGKPEESPDSPSPSP